MAENIDDLISRQQAIVTAVSAAIDWHKLANPQYSITYCIGAAMRQLPSAQPEIIHCEKCQFSEYDALYGDRYCHYDGKAEIVPDEHFCGYGRERQNG